MNKIKDDIKKLKLKRLIPYYKRLKIEAVKNQQYEEAANFRDLEKSSIQELNKL